MATGIRRVTPVKQAHVCSDTVNKYFWSRCGSQAKHVRTADGLATPCSITHVRPDLTQRWTRAFAAINSHDGRVGQTGSGSAYQRLRCATASLHAGRAWR